MKDKPIRSVKHLAHVRSYPCMITMGDDNCNGTPVIAHHATFLKGEGGMGQKAGDNRTMPLCQVHHQRLHSVGEKRFWKSQGWELDDIVRYMDWLWEKSKYASKSKQNT